MDRNWDKYELKLKVSRDKYHDICRNVDYCMKEDYKKIGVDVFAQIERMYKITPATLKEEVTPHTLRIRDFTLFMLVNYSKLSLDEIVDKFVNIRIEDLECMKDDKILYIKYEKQIYSFFRFYIDEYLDTIYKVLARIEEMTINHLGPSEFY